MCTLTLTLIHTANNINNCLSKCSALSAQTRVPFNNNTKASASANKLIAQHFHFGLVIRQLKPQFDVPANSLVPHIHCASVADNSNDNYIDNDDKR